MTSYHPLVASSAGTPSFVSPAADATLLSSSSTSSLASRIRTGPADSRILPEAKRPRSSASLRHPSVLRPTLAPMSTTRPAAVSSSAQDWVSAALPPTPALQACTYDHANAQTVSGASAWPATSAHGNAPATPVLDTRYAHCPTPELTPPDDSMVVADGAAGSHAAVAAPSATSATFIKRDDLTAKAIARAASMNVPAQPTLPTRQYSSAEESSTASLPSEKDRLVTGLVGASILAIESIWGQSVSAPSCDMATRPGGESVIPLQSFVKEVLRRSRTSCSTLQLALYYLHKSRRGIRDAVACAEASRGEIVRLNQELAESKKRALVAAAYANDTYPSPPQSPTGQLQAEVEAQAHAVHASAVAAELGERFTALVAAQNSPVLCGRRMFLAALISASKYLQDRNYSNRAWAKISGLPVNEINGNERAFLKVVDFQLHLPAEEFQRWTERLAALASPSSSPSPVEPVRPSPMNSSQYGLGRSASTYSASSTEQAQLAANVRATGPLTARARLALNRGHSAAAVLGASVSSTREKGFPIAAARPAPATVSSVTPSQMQYREVASPSAMSSVSSSSSSFSSTDGLDGEHQVPKRQLRSLPTRRSGASSLSSSSSRHALASRARAPVAMPAGGYVPSSWSSGGSTPRSAASLGVGAGVVRDFGVEGLELDAVRAH